MGWVTMGERDLQRIEVLTDVLAGRRTVAAAATVLAVSERQMYRLLAKYEDGGGSALADEPEQSLVHDVPSPYLAVSPAEELMQQADSP
jgi:Helix-turn-helix domain